MKSQRPALFCSTVILYVCVKTRGHFDSRSACIFGFWSVLAKGFRMDKASPDFHSPRRSIWKELDSWLRRPGRRQCRRGSILKSRGKLGFFEQGTTFVHVHQTKAASRSRCCFPHGQLLSGPRQATPAVAGKVVPEAVQTGAFREPTVSIHRHCNQCGVKSWRSIQLLHIATVKGDVPAHSRIQTVDAI